MTSVNEGFITWLVDNRYDNRVIRPMRVIQSNLKSTMLKGPPFLQDHVLLLGLKFIITFIIMTNYLRRKVS